MTEQEKDLLIQLLTKFTSLTSQEQQNENLLLQAKADVEKQLGTDLMDTKIDDSSDGFPTVMTMPQMAKFLQIGISKAYEMSHWVGFPAVHIGRQVRVPKKALLKWLEQQKYQERLDEAQLQIVARKRR
ncbi:helix-turn-helix domain-containing protein [Mahella australiensis]|uniref:DNA binding domain protein, excisionase family n=1 Tax=Mahella australiensis (strain DSM 15567 / CIP 107919 / 50-1 BON) TaxID=697281 RepID=F3ZVG6_MAHA5|nr:helix-turn-helix domain-containing protein [Mahella australiensis]AEE95316.1 DNA binding domain protein, excisionase family [Mahella australiensis 50-1 BON]